MIHTDKLTDRQRLEGLLAGKIGFYTTSGKTLMRCRLNIHNSSLEYYDVNTELWINNLINPDDRYDMVGHITHFEEPAPKPFEVTREMWNALVVVIQNPLLCGVGPEVWKKLEGMKK